MRPLRWLPGLLLPSALICGCSQPMGVRGPGSEFKTFRSVGDQSLPVRSVAGDSSVRSGVQEPLITSSNGRISGRVFDEKGTPVSDARVRLAVGSEAGGKSLIATTDRSGAFTLRGLRTGSSYTLIADYQDQNESMTGRTEVEVPESNVRISLHRRPPSRQEARSSIRPAKPSIERASNVVDEEEAENDDADQRFNREDIDPPAPEAEEVSLRPAEINDADAAQTSSARASRSASGWTQRRPSAGRPIADEPADIDQPSQSTRSRSQNLAPDLQEDEENPLPPAIESGRTSSADDFERQPDGRVKLARAMNEGRPSRQPSTDNDLPAPAELDTDERQTDKEAPEPRPLPDSVLDSARRLSPGAYGPIQMTDPDSASYRAKAAPARRSGSTLPEVRSRPAPSPTSAEPRRPTWGEISFMKPTIPRDEAILKTSRSNLTTTAPASMAAAANSSPGPAVKAARRLSLLSPTDGPACRFSSEKQLEDFLLPDVTGRMVSFRDFNSDLILLDFWGTWCGPCQMSVGHLVDIQNKLGGRLQVIGIACEKAVPKEGAKLVTQAVKRLGINYPVLVSSLESPCPVQESFQIQFYPTLVLLNREGKILWREQGATDVTLARMDRFIARNLNLGSPLQDESEAPGLARSHK